MAAPDRPCACGSGRRHELCCGAPAGEAGDGAMHGASTGRGTPPADAAGGRAMAARCAGEPAGRAPCLAWAPPGLLVVERYLAPDDCVRWRSVFDRQQTRPATVQDTRRRNPDGSPVYHRDPNRITDFVPKAELEDEVVRTLQGACRDVVAPHFGRELEWMSYPSVLKYGAGGEYKPHADSEHWDRAQRRWVRSLDRDYSILLYLNEDFEGGSLYFNHFDVRLKPATGMLVAFPSDHRYLHAAEPITAGRRYVVVCWTTARGTPRINPPPPGATRL